MDDDATKNPFMMMLSSRKAWVSIIGMTAVSILCALGRVDGKDAIDLVKFVLGAWLVSIGVEDAGRHIANRPATPPNNVSVSLGEVTSTVMDHGSNKLPFSDPLGEEKPRK